MYHTRAGASRHKRCSIRARAPLAMLAMLAATRGVRWWSGVFFHSFSSISLRFLVLVFVFEIVVVITHSLPNLVSRLRLL